MKQIYLFSFLFFLYCETAKPIPNPLKGSIENPILISGKENILNCFKKFEDKYKLKIRYVKSSLGVDFHLLDKFIFPYSDFKEKQNISLTTKEKYFYKKIKLYFYIDQYHFIDECKNNSIESLLEWE
ncbi:MAG: hypothetical protein ACK4UJ_04860 [Leptonema sp. (in: bacteria)]